MYLCLFSPFNTSGFLKLSGRQSGLGNLFKGGLKKIKCMLTLVKNKPQ